MHSHGVCAQRARLENFKSWVTALSFCSPFASHAADGWRALAKDVSFYHVSDSTVSFLAFSFRATVDLCFALEALDGFCCCGHLSADVGGRG